MRSDRKLRDGAHHCFCASFGGGPHLSPFQRNAQRRNVIQVPVRDCSAFPLVQALCNRRGDLHIATLTATILFWDLPGKDSAVARFFEKGDRCGPPPNGSAETVMGTVSEFSVASHFARCYFNRRMETLSKTTLRQRISHHARCHDR